MLGVLLAEVGQVRLDDVKELGDDGADAAEMLRSGLAAEVVGQFVDVNPGELGLGVHLLDRGDEEKVDAQVVAGLSVGIECAWVGLKVFIGAKLGGVDEDADDGAGALSLGGFDEGEMALVEGTHGGHEADAFAGGACLCDIFANLFYRFNLQHECQDRPILWKVKAKKVAKRYCIFVWTMRENALKRGLLDFLAVTVEAAAV